VGGGATASTSEGTEAAGEVTAAACCARDDVLDLVTDVDRTVVAVVAVVVVVDALVSAATALDAVVRARLVDRSLGATVVVLRTVEPGADVVVSSTVVVVSWSGSVVSVVVATGRLGGGSWVVEVVEVGRGRI